MTAANTLPPLPAVSSQYGAPMGRRSAAGVLPEHDRPLILAPVPLDDGYDAGGAYWGAPSDLWAATDGAGWWRFCRAPDRWRAALALDMPPDRLALPLTAAERDPLRGAYARPYAVAALWSAGEDDDGPLDHRYTVADIAPESAAQLRADLARFLFKARRVLRVMRRKWPHYGGADQIAHDFSLTRQGHGVGFWDRGIGKAGEILTRLSQQMRGDSLYVGDDGRLYV